MKNKDKLSKPTSAGRVAGKGLSTKWSKYYTAGQKERKTISESQEREVQELKAKYPLISEDNYKEFKIKCESSATSESSQWGKEMRQLNIGAHQLGPGGYRVAEPVWDKEDAKRAEQGLQPRFEKYLTSRPGTMSGPGTRWAR